MAQYIDEFGNLHNLDTYEVSLSREEVIKHIRSMFQSYDARSTLLKLMIEEVRLDLIKKRNKNVSYIEAAEVIVEEATDLKDVIFNNEVRSIMSGFGF